MGWSLDMVRPELDKVFKQVKIRYRASHPDAMSPRIHIEYEGDLKQPTMKYIADLFPDFVYIDFRATTFPQ